MEPIDNLSLSELFDLISAPDEQQADLSDLIEQGDRKVSEKKNNALNRAKTLSSAIQNVLDKVETI
jgi:hypothetical protein